VQTWNCVKEGLGVYYISAVQYVWKDGPVPSGEEKRDWFLDGWGQKKLLLPLSSSILSFTAKSTAAIFTVFTRRPPYLSMKEGSLFCFVLYLWDSLNRDVSWCLWKALDENRCMAFDSMTCGLAVQKFLNIEWFFSLKIKLN
jgi:hypothetical protein